MQSFVVYAYYAPVCVCIRVGMYVCVEYRSSGDSSSTPIMRVYVCMRVCVYEYVCMYVYVCMYIYYIYIHVRNSETMHLHIGMKVVDRIV